MEWMRRALLLLALVLSVGTAQYVSLEPLLYVRPLDLAEEQDDETAWTEEGQRLRALPLLEYIEETTRGILFKADTPEWRVFLENVLAVSRGGAGELSGHPWLFRVSAEDRDLTFYPRRVFFRPDEPPLQILRGRLEKNHDRLVAALDRPEGGSAYFEIVLQTYGDDDFHFGSGFSRRPRPPARFLRPCRKFSLWILLAGLLFYVLLPRPKLDRASIRYAPWRVVLGDVASLLMFLPFFALPFFIVGGTVQTFTQGWIFLLIMWPLAFVGVWLLHDMARSASYEIRLRDDGLELRMLRKARRVFFRDLDCYRPLVLKPPRWLITLTWLSALAGKGGVRGGAAGRAFLLSSAAYGGLGLFGKDGSSVNVWVTDQMGSAALKNAKRITSGLDRAGVRRDERPLEIRGVLAPEGTGPGGAKQAGLRNTLLFIFLIAPLAAVLLLLLFLR